MLRAIIFDFDGTVLDTEAPEYRAWQEVYAEYEAELALAAWARAVGGPADAFDPVEHLARLIGRPVERDVVELAQRLRARELTALESARPGVVALLREARETGLRLAVASSSHLTWVGDHLDRLGLAETFDTICTADDVRNVKPDPELYTLALRRLGVAAHEAIAVEDSPNGMLAARRAGLPCVVVPNDVTRHFDFPAPDARLDSLHDTTVDDIAALCIARSPNGRSRPTR